MQLKKKQILQFNLIIILQGNSTGLAGTVNPVAAFGDRQTFFCSCVLMFFHVYWQKRPQATAWAQLSWQRRRGSTITGMHTLSSSQIFAPMGTKAQCGETEKVDDNPQWGKERFWGCWKHSWRGISVAEPLLCLCISLHTCRCVTKSEFARDWSCSDDTCTHTCLNTLRELWTEMGWCQDFEGGVVSRSAVGRSRINFFFLREHSTKRRKRIKRGEF